MAFWVPPGVDEPLHLSETHVCGNNLVFCTAPLALPSLLGGGVKA